MRPTGPAIADAVVTKLRQLPPSIANVLVVAVDRPVAVADVDDAIRTLRARVDARDPATLARVRAADPRAFYERFLRLAGVIAFADEGPDGPRAAAGRTRRPTSPSIRRRPAPSFARSSRDHDRAGRGGSRLAATTR